MQNKPKWQAVGLAGGSSYILVLPKEMATGIGLEKGDFVKVTQEERWLRVEKAE